MDALGWEPPTELVTLRSGMSIGTFNAVLDLIQREYPCSVPVPEDGGVVRVMSHAPVRESIGSGST